MNEFTLLLFLLFCGILIIVVLIYKYVSLMDRMHTQIQNEIKAFRDNEIQNIKQEAVQQAQSRLREWIIKNKEKITRDAIKRSQAVTMGKVTEHFVPYLPNFNYNYREARFLGNPIDFIVFDGLYKGEVRNIVFIEVKTGTGALSTRERRIRDAVQSGRIIWQEYRFNPGES
ncbi:MAG: Holliday junction resolvase [Deltaproteobacteria bacterium]|nr:Holliday junction resolvase [Deltaproteobacteria bacterium]